MSIVTLVSEIPDCDIHKQLRGETIPAAYDGGTRLGSWAYMCEECFARFGLGLGEGCGQRLVLREVNLVES